MLLTLPVLYTVFSVPAGVWEGWRGLKQERSAAIGQGAVHHVAGQGEVVQVFLQSTIHVFSVHFWEISKIHFLLCGVQ